MSFLHTNEARLPGCRGVLTEKQLTQAPLSKNQILQGLKAPAGHGGQWRRLVSSPQARAHALPLGPLGDAKFPVLKDADTALASDPSAQKEPCSESFEKTARMREGRPAVTEVLSTDPMCSRCDEA